MNGFTSKISTFWPGLCGDANTKRSVKSRRGSSPGNLSMAALKWLDIVAPLSSAVGPPGRPDKPEDTPASERDLLHDGVGRYFGIRRARRGARRVLRPP